MRWAIAVVYNEVGKNSGSQWDGTELWFTREGSEQWFTMGRHKTVVHERWVRAVVLRLLFTNFGRHAKRFSYA